MNFFRSYDLKNGQNSEILPDSEMLTSLLEFQSEITTEGIERESPS